MGEGKGRIVMKSETRIGRKEEREGKDKGEGETQGGSVAVRVRGSKCKEGV